MEEPEEKELVLSNDIHARFSSASWYNHKQEIIIGGVGGIGSWLSLFLSRQGHSLNVFDDDVIEIHNIGGQLYSVGQVGESKVDATKETCERLSGTQEISTYDELYTRDSLASNIMFSCFDNMEARLIMFDNWCESYKASEIALPFIFIDGRLNAETAEIFCVTDEDSMKRYRDEWFDDTKVQDAPCTFKATSHCAAVLAGMMTACLNNFLSNFYHEEYRSVPYKTSIWLPTMMVQTEEK